MKTSPTGVQFIADHEGWVPHIYLDIAGIATIGYGHVVRPGQQFTSLTQDQGLQLLAQDLSIAEAPVNAGVTDLDCLSQPAFDALVSFTFNMGGNAFLHSTLLQKLNAGDHAGAADEFLRWDHAMVNGRLTVSLGLYTRRQAEREMFLQ